MYPFISLSLMLCFICYCTNYCVSGNEDESLISIDSGTKNFGLYMSPGSNLFINISIFCIKINSFQSGVLRS